MITRRFLLAGAAAAVATPAFAIAIPTNPFLDEWEQIKADPVYFAKRYTKVQVTPELERMLLQMAFSDRYRQAIVLNQRRQTGTTTAMVLFTLWYAVTTQQRRVVMFSEYRSAGLLMTAMFDQFFYNLPVWMKSHVDKSEIRATRSVNEFRGMNISLFVGDALSNYQIKWLSTYFNAHNTTTILSTRGI